MSEALQTPEVVLRFLESVGRRSDAEFYLSLFRAAAKERFACLCVDGPVLAGAADAVALDLRFLAALGLTPVVVLGLFDAGVAQDQAQALQRRLHDVGVAGAVLPPHDGLANKVVEAARHAVVPIVPLDASCGAREEVRFGHLTELLLTLRSERLIFLQAGGGLRIDGQLVPWVNLSGDFAALWASPQITGKHRFLLGAARELVCERAHYKLTVAIASPLELLRELFTVKGAGTFLRRGAVIVAHSSWQTVDIKRLGALLTSAFERQLDRAFFAKPPWRIYLDEDYRGAAVLMQTPLGVYLSKFAVERQAQGEGIGGDLWARLKLEHPVMFWRSRRQNSIDAWYVRQCQGLMRLAEWSVFWTGFAPSDIAAAVAWAAAQPHDFTTGSA